MARHGVRLVVDLVSHPGDRLDGIHTVVQDLLNWKLVGPQVESIVSKANVDVGCTWEEPD